MSNEIGKHDSDTGKDPMGTTPPEVLAMGSARLAATSLALFSGQACGDAQGATR